MSQPALSKQIRALERQLGAPLFVREPQGVRLTPAGTALLPHARRVLAAWDDAAAAVERAKSEQAATLVVGMSTSPARGGLLPAIRSRFTQAHPAADGRRASARRSPVRTRRTRPWWTAAASAWSRRATRP